MSYRNIEYASQCEIETCSLFSEGRYCAQGRSYVYIINMSVIFTSQSDSCCTFQGQETQDLELCIISQRKKYGVKSLYLS